MGEMNRNQLMKKMAVEKDPFKLAKIQFQAGFFDKSRMTCEAIPARNLETDLLYARCLYITGRYDLAEAALKALAHRGIADPAIQESIDNLLLMVYYQTNQYNQCGALFGGRKNHPTQFLHQQLMAFGEDKPYRVNWEGRSKVEIPFIQSDPLPIVALQVEGETIYAFIDTGGNTLFLDDQFAAKIKVKAVSEYMGTFGGGKQASVQQGIVRQVNLGGLEILNLPTAIMPLQRFSDGLTGGKYLINACIGTGILKQFLSTIDYPQEKLILRPSTETAKEVLLKENPNGNLVEVPFALFGSHLILARGSLNGVPDMTFFVDSGLASPAAFSAPPQTLKIAGISPPKMKVDKDGMGGGGGLYASGNFSIRELCLGPLKQEHLLGELGSRPKQSYWQHGYIEDGLISHTFLKQYAWSLDFNNMMMYFIY